MQEAYRWWQRPLLLDGLAAAAYLVLFAAQTFPRMPGGDAGALVVWVAVLAGMGAPLAVRRLWPARVFTVVFAASLVSALLDVVRDSFAAAAFALYTVALTLPRVRWVPTRTIGLVSAVTVVASTMAGPAGGFPRALPYPALLFGATLMGGSWTIGRAVRERHAYVARTAREAAARAVTEERLRIARELHDVVAHSMTLITVKAGIADHVAERRPEEARLALREIESVSRGALTEMRHMLGVLRAEAPAGPDDLRPVPGLARLPELAERAAAAGVRAELDVRGVDHLPEGVELSAYRIVQEALTNVVRHAAPARCRVVVHGHGGQVRVEVTDDGPGTRVPPAGAAPGHGLVGMRERVAMYGGDFSAGPRPGGGFAVSARLPYRPPGGEREEGARPERASS
ncbi:two-component sensor histidine kinase [Sphaerisporangium krabiense]|uniref:histidine kinase n=1 Tax=Sphaerisporangium krabiense TaxID=763782 RepID=A0A7W9DVA3_9ACTN|nr:sensor histidine kinase [Sphaerisporangium krabiense]MBB5631255.1 signal transduction histidine kinase [Sphaerisporangium krabiense]GII61132.1 two-component sensor histidine kinase [Sphaerisporangium krabiense]